MVALLIAGAGFLAVLVVFVKAARLRTAIYRYDVRADQHYDFSRAGCVALAARVTNGSLVLASPAPAGDVVFLEVRIRSTLLGHWFEPFIEIAASHRRFRQPVERGGSGVRYFVLNSLDLEGGAPLKLTGHHLVVPDQPVSLYCLEHSVDLAKERILVLGTHPDDAEIAAFGVYADRDAYVVTLTAGEAGEPGHFAKFGPLAHLEKGRHRAWNSVAVPLLGGLSIERTVNLGYFDGTLPAMREQPDAPVRSLHANAGMLDTFGHSHDGGLIMPRLNRPASWNNLVADLEHLVTTIRPGIVVTPYPRLDAHPDHRMSTAALLQALTNLNWQHGSLLLYANHLCSSDRYPFGDAGDSMSLPPGVGDIFFDGIVSNSLDATMQARKHMALDAMIDLRPEIEIDSLRSVAKAFKRVLKSTLTDGHASASYFRQAVRANELFFEVRMSSLHEAGVIDKLLG